MNIDVITNAHSELQQEEQCTQTSLFSSVHYCSTFGEEKKNKEKITKTRTKKQTHKKKVLKKKYLIY